MRRALILILACVWAVAGQARAEGMRPLQEWPLGACADDPVAARICLNGPAIWQRFGHGAPEIEVAVVETFETFAMGQILSQHPWLQHLDIRQFWHAQTDERRAQPRPQILRRPAALKERAPELVRFCDNQKNIRPSDELPSYCRELDAGDASFALAYLDWRDSSQHELKMIGLISGQSAGTLRRTGLAPLGTVSLHYIETSPSELGLRRLADRLDRRPGARVVNFSNEGPFEEMLDLQYERIYRSALSLNAGKSGVTGQNPDDRLFVASSANTIGVFSENAAFPRPHALLPPETILSRPVRLGPVHRPVIAHMLPAPDVPILVVGGITRDGKLADRTRIEPMIDLYAPSGVDWRTRERSRAQTADLQLDAVRAMQGCRSGPAAIENEAVPTLDWGQTVDIRSARYLDRTEAAWREAGDSAMFGPVGCFAPSEIDNAVYFDRIIGNSVATALVSAVAAQMFALDPQLSAADARDILTATARANRVSGLPVLDATAALEKVLAGYVSRLSQNLAPRSLVIEDSITSRSLSPGLLGQTAWRRMRDDPPLDIRFRSYRERADGRCDIFEVAAVTRTQFEGAHPLRIAQSPQITRNILSCPGRPS